MKIPGEYLSASPEQTLEWGKTLGRSLQSGEAVFLIGKLGTGKTVIARGIARGLGWEGAVNSPSFSLVKVYRGRMTIYHCDLYRLKPGEDIRQIGLEEQMEEADSVSIFEWSEDFPIAGYVPRWEVRIGDGVKEEERVIRWEKVVLVDS